MKPARANVQRLGLVIPCRNEAAVIERKLRNVALGRFETSALAHVVVVIDDGSDDDTAQRARALTGLLAAAGLTLRVVANTVRPGKPGAIRQGIQELADDVDLIVLTDADVVVDPDAWSILARALASDDDLALACGAQRFVRELDSDGTCRGARGAALIDASNGFDRWTARVRRMESAGARLFSVHGQLLAWRASLALVPAFGIAADDLDVMFQVRARTSAPRGVRCVARATFFEVKTPPGEAAQSQALRRARAYVQVLRASVAPARPLDRVQWWLYRFTPPLAARLVPVVAIAVAVIGWACFGWIGAALTGLVVTALAVSPLGRRWRSLTRVIERAYALERESTLPERWEMVRR